MSKFKNITVDGGSVENYLDRLDNNEMVELMTADKYYPKRKQKVRYEMTREENGPVLTREEVEIKDLLASGKLTHKEVVTAHLLTGRHLTARDVLKMFDKMNNSSDASRILKLVYDSEFGNKYITRKRKGKGYIYYMAEPLSISSEKAMQLLKTKRKKTTPPKAKELPREDKGNQVETKELKKGLEKLVKEALDDINININVQLMGAIKFVISVER